MAYGVVRTDNMYATDVRGGGLVSVLYAPSNTPTAIENGNVVLLNGLKTGEREITMGVTPAANSALKDIVLIATPEVMYCQCKRRLDEFINEAGRISRGYHLHVNDIFSVTADCLTLGKNGEDAEIEVGDVVELAASTKLNVVDSLTSNSTQVGKVIEIAKHGVYTYYAIQVG